jgi:hypothetical protein
MSQLAFVCDATGNEQEVTVFVAPKGAAPANLRRGRGARRVLGSSFCGQRGAQVRLSRSKIGLEPHGFLQVVDRFIQPSHSAEGGPQVRLGFGIVRV